MTYSLETKREDSYLSVIASGDRTRANLKAIAEEIIEVCLNHKVYKIMSDIRNLEGRLTIFDSYTLLSTDLPNLKNKDLIQEAVLIDAENRKERSHFFNKVAKGMNLNIRIFENYEKASDWLHDDQLIKSIP